MKSALICGISGQDGGYLAAHLLGLGYRVVGTSRDAHASGFESLKKLGIYDRITIESMTLIDFRSVVEVLDRVRPDEIYNLAGQSSIAVSFAQPLETFQGIVMGTIHLLEAVRVLGLPSGLFNAGSSEIFGPIGDVPVNERSQLKPRNSYAIAKASALWQVAHYREVYGIRAVTGILFNHESPLRPARFVTQKVVEGACRIAAGTQTTITIGDMSVRRDWGWAPETVVAMHRMLAMETPEDLIVATGKTYSLEEFVANVFETLGLDWTKYVVRDSSLVRPSDHSTGLADPSRAEQVIGWKARFSMPEVSRMMVEAKQSEKMLHTDSSQLRR